MVTAHRFTQEYFTRYYKIQLPRHGLALRHRIMVFREDRRKKWEEY